jgi:hypothetical protein
VERRIFHVYPTKRVGRARIYAKLDKLDFAGYMDAIKKGKSYVSDGYSHLIDFTINGVTLGDNESELKVKANTVLNVSVKATGFLTEKQDEIGAIIAARTPYQSPYWHIERARVGTSRMIPVELIVNGVPVEKKEISADGMWQDIKFTYPVTKSSWVAIRVYQSSHTNPIFVIVDGKPIVEKKSVQWCRDAVDQCWKMKKEQFRSEEMAAAQQGYDHARKVYDEILMKAR